MGIGNRGYHLDLRERVLLAIGRGMTVTEASEVFQVNRTTIHDWKKILQESGSLHPRPLGHTGPARSISESLVLEEVKKNPGMPQKALAKKLGVGPNVISKILAKYGWTRKKNPINILKEIKRKRLSL